VSGHNLDVEAVQGQQQQEKGKKNNIQPSLAQPSLITASAAKKKVNLYLGLHWGQNFSVDEPVLQEEDHARWVIPVWYSTPSDGRTTKMLDVNIDARTGELLEEANVRQMLDRFGE
jgi:hypothetical protein